MEKNCSTCKRSPYSRGYCDFQDHDKCENWVPSTDTEEGQIYVFVSELCSDLGNDVNSNQFMALFEYHWNRYKQNHSF